MLELPYGRVPYPLDLGRPATVLEPRPMPPPRDLTQMLDEALTEPLGMPPLHRVVAPAARVTIIVSDATRAEPRRQFLEALARHLPATRWTVAIATGTHGPSPIEPLDLPPDLLGSIGGATLINHDGHSPADLVELGVTARGTPVRVHRCLVETDLVIATGCIRPHYFAGFGAGAKALFPGLGEATAIRINHAHKTAPLARAGIVDGNPCRDDIEEAVRMVPSPSFLLNGVLGPDGAVHAVVAGDLFRAFRAGADLARTWFRVRAPRAPLVVASDALPITASLYQAAKIAAAAAPLVLDGGTLAIVAECPDGTGPLPIVNEAIFRIGILPRLAPNVSLKLISSLDPATVAQTLLGYADSVRDLARDVCGDILVIPQASQLLFEASS